MRPILKTVLQRLGLGLLTLFIVSIVIFSALLMLPGGFAQAILGQSATPETIEVLGISSNEGVWRDVGNMTRNSTFPPLTEPIIGASK